jgi:hypothetical protein
MNTPDFKLDHFKLYDVVDQKVEYKLTLQGQFDKEPRPAVLRTVLFFANPVSKNKAPIHDRDAHLIWYQLYQPSPEPTREVFAENQFGRQRIRIGKPLGLLVPAQKQGHEMPKYLDHFKLYWVLEQQPVTAGVALDDEFGSGEAKVMELLAFGVPVQKVYAGKPSPIINKRDHLMLYRITPKQFTGQRSVRDQFTLRRARTLTFLQSIGLAVPSLKLEWKELW